MILSHEHKFIFIKTRKTAGTTIEVYLAPFCGPSDIVTPISPADEPMRAPHGPRNYQLPLMRRKPSSLVKSLVGLASKRDSGFYNHMPAAEVERLVGPETWNRYLKFTTVRNPYSQMVSWYHWSGRAGEDFERFVERAIRRGIPNWRVHTIAGQFGMDFYVRQERLLEDLAEVSARIGIPVPSALPKAKPGKRGPSVDWRSLYTPKTREVVAAWAAPEIEKFGYSFD